MWERRIVACKKKDLERNEGEIARFLEHRETRRDETEKRKDGMTLDCGLHLGLFSIETRRRPSDGRAWRLECSGRGM